MRGLRSTIALLVVLVGLGAYIYFVTWKQDGNRGVRRGEGLPSVEADKIEEMTIKSEAATSRPSGRKARAGRSSRRSDRRRRVRRHRGCYRAGQLEIARVIDENPADLTTTASRRRASRSSSRPPTTSGRQAAHRRQDADRRQPLREAERREARVPDSRVPGLLAQQVDLRPARQDGHEVRSRQGRRPRRHRRRQESRVRQEGQRLEDHQPLVARPTSARLKGWSAACRASR